MDTNERTFTDAEVTEACGLHIDNLRRLITWRAVRPVQFGGGRGRVRLWTMSQAIRIAVTAEFFRAGFALQMAHTITYCLPLDDMLTLYDLNFVKKYAGTEDAPHCTELVNPLSDNPMPDRYTVGSEILIVNNRYLYSDALADSPTLFAVIDVQGNRVIPVRGPPTKMLYGIVYNNDPEFIRRPYILSIDEKSLLIDEMYLRLEYQEIHEQIDKITGGVDPQIIDIERLNYRSFTKINLNIGLYIAFRKLMKLPVNYELTERPDVERDEIPGKT